jgi:hypothetical protein
MSMAPAKVLIISNTQNLTLLSQYGKVFNVTSINTVLSLQTEVTVGQLSSTLNIATFSSTPRFKSRLILAEINRGHRQKLHWLALNRCGLGSRP